MPVCGGRPHLAVLEKDTGKKFLYCALCEVNGASGAWGALIAAAANHIISPWKAWINTGFSTATAAMDI
jgi:hypothetical protein